jgi:hypothetical protein
VRVGPSRAAHRGRVGRVTQPVHSVSLRSPINGPEWTCAWVFGATSPRARLPSPFADQHIRYVLNRSYVLLATPQIEPITEQVPDQIPLRKAQGLDRQAYESPALPLSYSAVALKLIERDPEQQTAAQERITRGQHMTILCTPMSVRSAAMISERPTPLGAVDVIRLCVRGRVGRSGRTNLPFDHALLPGRA